MPYWTNREAVQVEQPPASLIVIGGGAIGLEFAQSFSRFGTTVTVVEAADRLLPREEPEAAELLTEVLGRGRDRVRTGASREKVAHDGTRSPWLSGRELGGRRTCWWRPVGATDLPVWAWPRSGGHRRKCVEPDERLRVADGVYAIGDVTGQGAFTHVAMYQADIVVRHILGQDGPAASTTRCRGSPSPTPRSASVGLTEAQARDAGIDVRTATARCLLRPRLDPPGRQRRADQTRRGRRPRSPRRRHLRRSARR